MENAQRRLQHARGLEHQEQLLRATDNKAADLVLCSPTTTTTSPQFLPECGTRQITPQCQPCLVGEA